MRLRVNEGYPVPIAGRGRAAPRFGWQPASDGELNNFHDLDGCSLGAPMTNDAVMRRIYALSLNDLTRIATAYRVTPASIGHSSDREWKADPLLTADKNTYASFNGANRDLRTDRGRQGPLLPYQVSDTAA